MQHTEHGERAELKKTHGKSQCKLAEPQSSDSIEVMAHQLPSEEAVQEVSQAGEKEDDARHKCSTLFIPEPHCSSQAGMNDNMYFSSLNIFHKRNLSDEESLPATRTGMATTRASVRTVGKVSTCGARNAEQR